MWLARRRSCTRTVKNEVILKRAANGPQIAICLGGWVVFDRPRKKKGLFFFSPPKGVRYLYNTD